MNEMTSVQSGVPVAAATWPSLSPVVQVRLCVTEVRFSLRPQPAPSVMPFDDKLIAIIVAGYAATKGWRPSKMVGDPELDRVRNVFRIALSGTRRLPVDDPVFWNAELCGTGGQFMWRTGVPGDQRWLPTVEATRRLYKVWLRQLHREFDRLKTASARDKHKFCLRHYAWLTALKPYRYGNTRTAMLLYYDLHRALGLRACIISGDTFGAFQRLIERFQRRCIRPELKRRGFLLR